MPFKFILFEKKDYIATITLNRPEKLNAMNNVMLSEVTRAVINAENDNNVRVIVITGKGKAFSVGGDLESEKNKGDSVAAKEKTFRLFNRAVDMIVNLKKPVVAGVNGYALAGGFELMLACDLVIAADNALIGDQHVNVGLVSPWGSVNIAPQVMTMRKAKELFFLGDKLTGAQAEKIGLINRAVPADQLDIAVREIAARAASKSPTAVRIVKNLINHAYGVGPANPAEFGVMSSLVNTCSADYREGIQAFMEKRQPKFKGK